MNGRRMLVIGSQCQKLNTLSFLPEVAVRLHELLTAPGPGECRPADAGDPPGLLLDPAVAEAEAAIIEAYDDAARGGETLILAYVGHGELFRDDFFLMPTNAASPPNSKGAIHLAQVIKERPECPAGLIVLLDTCYSGAGAWDASEYWVRSLAGALRFEVLTATGDSPTAGARFTRSLIRLLERGDPAAPEQLRCEDAAKWVTRAHPELSPQHSTLNSGGQLRLGRNASKVPGDVFWKESPGRVQILEQTEYFQPTAGLDELVAASRADRVVILTGEAGVGKSTMAAALARPEITDGRVPPGFAHAVAMLGVTTNLRNLAVNVQGQLHRSVAGFAAAVEAFQRDVPRAERDRLDFLRQMVLSPLDYLEGRPTVRIVLDGLDQLPDGTRRLLREVLDAAPGHLHLVITARDDTPDGPEGRVLQATRTDRAVLARYLEERGVSEAARAAILDRAQRHWLIAQLLADAVLDRPDLDLSRLPRTVNDAYAVRLDQAGAAADWPSRFRPVLGLLAVAGSGPVLPMALLAHASTALGGPVDASQVREVLVDLRGLVVRRNTGTKDEHAGLFHLTLAEYLLSSDAASAGFAIDAEAAHRALAEAIDALAPASGHKANDPLHRYAFLREADHWWAVGEFDRALRCLGRESNILRENLDRSLSWYTRIFDRWAPTTPTPSRRASISRTGPARRARRGRRCGCSASCCRTWSGCRARTTRIPS